MEKQYANDYKNLDGEEHLWTLKSIGGHTKIDGKWNVLVNWEDRTMTWESLSIIAKDDPVTIALYAKEENLVASDHRVFPFSASSLRASSSTPNLNILDAGFLEEFTHSCFRAYCNLFSFLTSQQNHFR